MRRKEDWGRAAAEEPTFIVLVGICFAVSSDLSLPLSSTISIFLHWLFRVPFILLNSPAFKLYNKEFGRCPFCGRRTWGLLTKLPISFSMNQHDCRVWVQNMGASTLWESGTKEFQWDMGKSNFMKHFQISLKFQNFKLARKLRGICAFTLEIVGESDLEGCV